MQHYQVPSVEYSSYINHVISLGLAEDYIAQLRASCFPKQPTFPQSGYWSSPQTPVWTGG